MVHDGSMRDFIVSYPHRMEPFGWFGREKPPFPRRLPLVAFGGNQAPFAKGATRIRSARIFRIRNAPIGAIHDGIAVNSCRLGGNSCDRVAIHSRCEMLYSSALRTAVPFS